MRCALVIAGASGAGKTTIANLLLQSDDFELVRSATTRPVRNDQNTSEYMYLTRDEFLRRKDNGEMLEFTEYGENLYGTPKSELERIYSVGKIPLLIVDLAGVKTFIEGDFDFCPRIFYIYENLNVIERRLYERELSVPTPEGLESFVRRKETNIKDYLELPQLCEGITSFVRNSDAFAAASAIRNAFFEESFDDDIITSGDKAIILSKELYSMACEKM